MTSHGSVHKGCREVGKLINQYGHKNLEENKAYAASKNINKIVAVNGKITEIDLDNNEEKTIDIESLLNKEAE